MRGLSASRSLRKLIFEYMVKLHLKSLFLLMAFAVAAVIFAQVYWIYSSYKFQQKNITSNAREALEKTASFIESDNGCLDVFNKIELNPQEDLVILRRGFHEKKESVLDTVKQYSGSFSQDSLVSYRSLAAPFAVTAEIHVTYHYTPGDSIKSSAINTHNHLSRINKLEKERFFSGSYGLTYALGDNYCRAYIDSLLKLNLKAKHIDSRFYFQLKDKKKNIALLQNYKQQKQTAGLQPLAIDIFRNSEFYTPQTLYLWLPDQDKILLSKTWWLMLISFLLLLVLGIVVFVTIRTLLRQKKISQMKSDFISNMTHEFKTPISNISLALETIQNSEKLNSSFSLEQYLSIICSENSRMHENVERILQISMMDKEDLSLKQTFFDLLKTARTVADIFRLLVEQKGGEIRIESEMPEAMAFGDEVHISNVIYNLIDNAIKYNDRVPDILISIGQLGNEITLQVSDNGIGISEADQQFIFDRFYRVPTGNIHNVKGFGLGLCYVKKIVEVHGGEIKVRSRKGAGTDFILHLSAMKAPAMMELK